VRHLVLPRGLAGTKGIVEFVSREISRGTHVNVMGQYRPCYKASQIPGLEGRTSVVELQEALSLAQEAGLSRLDRVHLAESLRICPH